MKVQGKPMPSKTERQNSSKFKTSALKRNSEFKKTFSSAKDTSMHPDHSVVKGRLNKIRGQIDGVEKMINEKRYCVDILTQLKASSSALKSIEGIILKKHLNHCVQDVFLLKDTDQIETKIDEIVKLSLKS